MFRVDNGGAFIRPQKDYTGDFGCIQGVKGAARKIRLTLENKPIIFTEVLDGRGGETVMCCQDKGGCQHPELLKMAPHQCTSEQIKECHGDETHHPCVEKPKNKET